MVYNETYRNDLREALKNIPNVGGIFRSNILVTGATGMIGSCLVDLLSQMNIEYDAKIGISASSRCEESVRSRFSGCLCEKDIKFVDYDLILNDEGHFGFDYIIHTAAPANPTEYSLRPVETMTAIVEGTKACLNLCNRCSAKRFIYVSSSEVYGIKNSDNPYEENDYGYVDILNSRSCYPMAKRAAETLCASYGKEYGLSTVIVRPGHVYGPTMTPADTRVASDFIRMALNGNDIVMKSEGNQLRSHCFVVDCASAIVTALINGEDNKAYNISHSEGISTIREYAECVSALTGRKLLFDLPTNQEKIAFNPMQNASLSSIEIEKIGWKGIFDLRTGISHTLKIVKGEK